MSEPVILDPLIGPEVLAGLMDRIAVLDRFRDVASTAGRLEHVAVALTHGRPEAELFELAAAIALWGLYQCRLRDNGRPTRVPPHLQPPRE